MNKKEEAIENERGSIALDIKQLEQQRAILKRRLTVLETQITSLQGQLKRVASKYAPRNLKDGWHCFCECCGKTFVSLKKKRLCGDCDFERKKEFF